ncbi:MAG: helix-turn-helix transcriptional regulator [Nakamurella sp.]
MDRGYAGPLDIGTLARIAIVSPAHFIRVFAATFGETPHRYLQRRRIERAAALLRDTDLSVSAVCVEVGFGSFATFTRTFRGIMGQSPSVYRRRAPLPAVPTCFEKSWLRPSTQASPVDRSGSFGQVEFAEDR